MAHAPSSLNFLVIMSDQHSPRFMSCAGDSLVRTPNLDRLAREGTRFTDAYCPSPLCVPSRMAFMTSRIPSRIRVWNNQHILSSAVPTWAHVMGAAGYETSLIGRMHFVGPDQRHGFENRPIGERSAGNPGAPELGGPSWRHFPSSTSGQERAAVEIAGRGRTSYQWFDEQVSDAACAYLRGHAGRGRAAGQRPFAAVVGMVLPHCPFIAPRDLYDYYYDRVEVPAVERRQPSTIERFRRVRRILDPPLSEKQIRVARAAYYGLCEHLDRQIGSILETLDATGLAERTMVIYCSDHGEMVGEHGCWWKSNYYQGSVGVPLIVRLPGTVRAGAVCDGVVNLMDIGPTLVDLAGAAPEGGIESLRWDGRSMARLFREGSDPQWVQETASELVDKRGGKPNFPSRMIRSGAWKLWVYGDREKLPPALFNLEEDPDELHDLGTDPAHGRIRDELLRRVSRDWDPEVAERGAVEAEADHDVIAAWGRATLPSCEDALPAPPPELEADVELL